MSRHPHQPKLGEVQCLSPSGMHHVRYLEWGDPDNDRVVVCVHGLTRSARDFDHLARALCADYRVICPDIVGRGRSDWLRDPRHYAVPQYVSDMVTLVARLDVPQLAWVGTSMGGLIGMGLAGLPGSPIGRLVLNDVGPSLEPGAVARIGSYVGRPIRFASLDEAVAYNRSVAAGFAMRDDAEWREITETVLKRDGDGYVFHYDPAIGAAFKELTIEAAAAGEKALWALYDGIAARTLLIRGALSDLLTEETTARMQERGPRPRVVTFPGVGHAPMFFDPAQIQAVRDFLLEA